MRVFARIRGRRLTKYPGIRPIFSVIGTKSKGAIAAPIFHDSSAKERYGKFVSSIFHMLDICSEVAPYAPAGRPVRIELAHSKLPSNLMRSSTWEGLHEAYCQSYNPFVRSRPVEPVPAINLDAEALKTYVDLRILRI